MDQPAARDATISLMSLYERSSQKPSFFKLPYDNGFAIRHYNRAMKEIRSLKSVHADQLDIILISCVLFACIEFTRRDINAAMTHIKHGIDLMNASQHRSKIAAIFRYMSLTPVFSIQSIWVLPLIDHCPPYETPETLRTFTEVQGSINSIQYDAVKLARMKGEYRASERHTVDAFGEMLPPNIIEEQKRLNSEVESLRKKFAEFRARLAPDPKLENISCILQLRWTMLKIWAVCLGENDEVYDTCMDDFERILNFARKSQLLSTTPGFMLEVGLLPYLYFVIVKCRSLQLRLRALSLIKKGYSHNYDIFWDPAIIFGMSKKILRAEYGFIINDSHASVLDALQDSPFFADNTRLCRDFAVWELDTRIDLPETKGRGFIIGYIPTSEVLNVPEWKRDHRQVSA
ncbi:hypothetical protein N7466_010370 [Penicillium verhagenii]|uniref:uncharacterized protein n=1 Tax=Penicillium verhagenii TaxID=1562060 RepID=UPI002545A974|nr:uncharacterized protein N7466_010370 [Penicillium verhagenii]KAJ5919427.1 hypothetical protein N7466_010370 [Penicillium verhagenii]